MDTEQIEIVAMLFAAWNDFLIAGEPVSDDSINEDVRDHWNVSKQEFTPQRLAIALKWMRDRGLVPSGIGPQTIRADAA